ncbi:hypothetical protein NHX12_032567 [Muraenolepis orangiensis]|uniref:Uncharacterized protein n=1 Tax=Muraenolepis orangiensis TaxID=630683 RepID=A0A9Q0IJZ9_9TELE|nr:hypothetical protein NHX12_032567 [Muraenolepis orangiensis]
MYQMRLCTMRDHVPDETMYQVRPCTMRDHVPDEIMYQASPTEDEEAYERLGKPPFPSPSFNLPENPHSSYTPWPNNAEDPFELLQCTQNRDLSDENDCDGVTDLYGLVSNNLEDGDSLDRFSQTERESSIFMSIWSPKTTGNYLLQYGQSDTKTEANPALFPHHKYSEQVQGNIPSKDIKNMCQQLNSFNTNNQWLSKSSDGDVESCQPCPLPPLTKPPGLPMPSVENRFLSTMRGSQHHVISNDTSRGTLGPFKHIPIQTNGFGQQSKMDSPLLNAYENQSIQSCPTVYQQNTPQEIRQMVSNFQDLIAAQERMAKQKNQMIFPNSRMSPLRGDMGPVQRELNGGIMHSFQGSYRFQGENTKHVQQSTSNSASFNPTKSHQGKVMTNGQTPWPNGNQVLNRYSQDQVQQCQLPNKASRDRGCVPSKPNQCQPGSPWQFPQMPRSLLYKQDYSSGDGTKVHYRPGQTQKAVSVDTFRKGDGGSGLQRGKSQLHSTAGDFVKGDSSTQRTESNARPWTHTDNQKHAPQPGNTYGSQRFAVGDITAGAWKQPQFPPFTHPASDPRQSSFQMGEASAAALSSRPSPPHGSRPSYRDICDQMPEGKFAAFNPNVALLTGQRAEGVYPGMASALGPPHTTRNRGGPAVILLNKTFPGKQISVATSSPLPKRPPHPSRVDRLIVDQTREHARLVNLLGKMEQLSSFPFHGNISSSLDRHYEAICASRTRRQDEYINGAIRHKQGIANSREDIDTMLLGGALKDLCDATRKSRTALWCALQVTVPKSAGVLDLRGGVDPTASPKEDKTVSF